VTINQIVLVLVFTTLTESLHWCVLLLPLYDDGIYAAFVRMPFLMFDPKLHVITMGGFIPFWIGK
jgi:hypothetical protein